MLMCIFMTSIVFGLSPCTTEASTDSTAFINVSNGTTQSITFGADEIWSSFSNITPTTSFQMDGCEDITLTNATNSSLYWPAISSGAATVINVTNSSSDILPATNYTVYATPGIIYFEITGPDTDGWDGKTVNVCYNKTFTAAVTDLVSMSLGYSSTGSTAYGGTTTWEITKGDITEHDWTTTYILNTRTCAARDSCAATQQTIFAGFGLLAVGIIVLAAFALIQMSNGGGVDMTAVAIGSIAIGVVLMIGFIIISQVGQTICQATVG